MRTSMIESNQALTKWSLYKYKRNWIWSFFLYF